MARWCAARPRPLTAGSPPCPPTVAQRPELTLLAGQLAHGSGRLGEAVEHCRAAVAAADSNGAPPFLRFAARFALADALLGVGDLPAAAALGDALDDPAADGDLSARALGALAAIALALQGRFEEGRELCDRAFADPVAAPIRGQLPVYAGYYLELPAGRLDDALLHVEQAIAAFERFDPFGRLPYVLLFKFAIHEERGSTTTPSRSPPAGGRWRAGPASRAGSAPARRSGSRA